MMRLCRFLVPHWSLLLLAILLPGAEASAASGVLVLDFGLKDDTLLPNVPAEVARVGELAPFVRSRLKDLGRASPASEIDAETQAQIANGYLLAHTQKIQELGRAAGVPWVAVGYSNKFSFLISWTRVFIVDTASGLLVARAEADLRGAMTDKRMTRRCAVSLADQIDDMLTTIERQQKAGATPQAAQGPRGD